MIEQRSPKWYAQRRGRVTASSVGAILGVSPFMSRDGVMRAMVRECLGAPSEFPDPVPPPVAWGNAMEDTAIGEFEDRTGLRVERVGFIPMDDWAGVSPDGLIGEDEGIETKCPYSLRNDPNPIFKSLAEQPHYLGQVQFTLWVTKRKRWYFEQWSPHGNRTETVTLDQRWVDDNVPRLRQFWAELQDTLKDKDACAEHLAPLRVTIDTPEAAKMVAEWDDLTEALERATERKKELLAEMVALAGDRNAIIGGRKLTLTQKAGAVSYGKAIKALCPKADLTPYTGKPSSYWGLK